jgi:hypothetical protein
MSSISKTTITTLFFATMFSTNVFAAKKPVPIEKLQDRTSEALGLDAENFTVSDITRDGVSTRYKVKTKSGKIYRCYVTSVSGLMAKLYGAANVSDAVCSANGEPPKNALLEAAGKSK